VVIATPMTRLEEKLSNVESWPAFLVGVESVHTLGHERYRFRLAAGRHRRETTVCVRHWPQAHRFTWRALEGPQYTGTMQLRPVDAWHTAVKLCLSSHPVTLAESLVEMVLPRMGQAATDLRRLEEHVLAVGR
jgi:uncharacterized membrane protein